MLTSGVAAQSANLLLLSRIGSVIISVTDSGAGLSEQQLAEICSEGVQFNANELQAGRGSGLGLFISKGLVEQHGGAVTVTSPGLGLGTTFSIALPLFARNGHEKCSEAAIVTAATAGKPFIVKQARESINGAKTFSDIARFPSNSMFLGMAQPNRRILVVDDAASNRKMLIRLLAASRRRTDSRA